ncbi:MAG: hypothetical protein NVSMB26_24720 [Beijerinckiaceae bacterium]
MPHIVVEYSANLEDGLSIVALVRDDHKAVTDAVINSDRGGGVFQACVGDDDDFARPGGHPVLSIPAYAETSQTTSQATDNCEEAKPTKQFIRASRTWIASLRSQ